MFNNFVNIVFIAYEIFINRSSFTLRLIYYHRNRIFTRVFMRAILRSNAVSSVTNTLIIT